MVLQCLLNARATKTKTPHSIRYVLEYRRILRFTSRMFHREVSHGSSIRRKASECETAFLFISSEAVTPPPPPTPSIWYSDMKPNTLSDPTQLCFNPSMRCVIVLMLYVNTTWQSVVKVAGQQRNCEVHIFCVLSVGDVRCSTRRVLTKRPRVYIPHCFFSTSFREYRGGSI